MTLAPLDSPAEHASALAALVRGRTAEIDAARRLPPDIADALRKSPLLRLLMPRKLGGDGGNWHAAIHAVEAVAAADGATGWSLMIGMVGNMLTGYIDEAEATALFKGATPYLAGVFEPRGIAKEIEQSNAYRISGRWRFATGVHLSEWCFVGAFIRTSSGQGVRQFLVPRSDIAIHSNWDVFGLSGTGSDDIELKNAEVAAARSFAFGDSAWPEDALWRIPFFSVAASLMGAAVLGIARSGMDFVLANARASDTAIAGFGQNQCLEVEISTAEAKFRSARAYLQERVAALDAFAREGVTPDECERADIWLAAVHAVNTSADILDLLLTGSPASVIRRNYPLQQCWRDVRAACQHVLVNRRRFEAVGRVLLGAPANASPFL